MFNLVLYYLLAGRIRNIYFPFDIEADTALSVATEMVAELDITDQDVTKIADMIDGEIASLVPEWRPGPGIEETPRFANQTFCHNCASNRTSNGSLVDFLSNNPCCRNGCASMHGRFEEITFQADEPEHHLSENAPNLLSHSDSLQYQEIWGQHESRELTPVGSGRSHSDEEYENLDQSISRKDDNNVKMENEIHLGEGKSILHLRSFDTLSRLSSLYSDLSDSKEGKIQQELRWLKAKYQIELGKLRDQQLGIGSKASTSSSRDCNATNGVLSSAAMNSFQESTNGDLFKSLDHEKLYGPSLSTDLKKSCPNSDTRGARNCRLMNEPPRTGDMVTAKSFYSRPLLPHSLHRTTSLPVDAVDA